MGEAFTALQAVGWSERTGLPGTERGRRGGVVAVLLVVLLAFPAAAEEAGVLPTPVELEVIEPIAGEPLEEAPPDREPVEGPPPRPTEVRLPGAGAPGASPVTVGPPRVLSIRAGGRTVQLEVRPTSLAEEFLVAAEAPALKLLAEPFGATLQWDASAQILRCTGPRGDRTLALGQARLEGEEGREVAVPARLVEGRPHVPLSILEDFLGARLTFTGEGVVHLEPLIEQVRLEGDPRHPRLVVRSTAPVTFRSFALRNPDRYVVDIPGAVLDVPGPLVHHPDLGNVRLGQFQLGPAVSRLVIPTEKGVKVSPPSQRPARELAFELDLPGVEAPAESFALQKVLEVRLDPMLEGQRLVIATTGPVQYEWKRLLPPDNRFLLDIPQAVLVGPKRELEVEDPCLERVRISQFQSEPVPVVRVVVDLARPAETRLTPADDDHGLALEVHHREIDPGMAMLHGYGITAYPSPGGVICIDPGHGGSDPGAINRALGVTEKEVTLDLAHRLAEVLRRQGWNVVMTRKEDRDVSWPGSSAREELAARVQIANDMGADVFLSIHCNASVRPELHGTSLHVYKRSDRVLAEELLGSVLAGTRRRNNGIRRNRFYVLAHTRMPAVLIETAFLTNPEEGRMLANPDYRQVVAESIADGLRRYAARHLNRPVAER